MDAIAKHGEKALPPRELSDITHNIVRFGEIDAAAWLERPEIPEPNEPVLLDLICQVASGYGIHFHPIDRRYMQSARKLQQLALLLIRDHCTSVWKRGGESPVWSVDAKRGFAYTVAELRRKRTFHSDEGVLDYLSKVKRLSTVAIVSLYC
jgi:hypothetical protein